MAFRNLFVSSRAYVRSFQNRIKLEKEDTVLEIPFEDLGSVVMEGYQTTITVDALKSLAENNSALFVCNDKHLPIGVFLSFQNHSRQVKQIRKQLAMKPSLSGKLWKSLVEQKVLNQAEVLSKFSDEKVVIRLRKIAEKVTVHDKSNRESYASNIYFPNLFHKEFTRRQELKINSALNYGFSILRGVIARHISAYGLLPSVGIHHKNEYNNFNLADDLIEPYRPFVEYFVKLNISYSETPELEKSDRASLFDILNMQVEFNSGKYSLETSIEQMVKSFVSALNKNDFEALLLPKVVTIKRKIYE